MEPWGPVVLTEYSFENFSSRITGTHLLLRKDQHVTFVKKTSMSNPVKSLRYILSATTQLASRPIKGSSSSIRSCQTSKSRSRRPKTILKIRKETTFFNVINNPIIHKVFKDFTNYRKKANRAVVLCHESFPNIPICSDHQRDLSTVLKTSFLHTYWRLQLVCIKKS